ncbi:Craniofacial development protein 1, partial [Nowakowskiella sp. JEL0078]
SVFSVDGSNKLETTVQLPPQQTTKSSSNENDISKSPLNEESTKVAKRTIKRGKSKLDALAAKYGVPTATKLNTLEKSKVDWNMFVVNEGIRDELTQKNKDGYLEKVAFLQRTDERIEDHLNLSRRKK